MRPVSCRRRNCGAAVWGWKVQSPMQDAGQSELAEVREIQTQRTRLQTDLLRVGNQGLQTRAAGLVAESGAHVGQAYRAAVVAQDHRQ